MCLYTLKQIFLNLPAPKSWGRNFQCIEAGIEIYDITQWGENTIDVLPPESGSNCRKTGFNLNFKTEEFYQITRNGDEAYEFNGIKLPKLAKPRVDQIVDGKNIINEEFSKLNKVAFEMLSSDFQNKVAKLQASKSE